LSGPLSSEKASGFRKRRRFFPAPTNASAFLPHFLCGGARAEGKIFFVREFGDQKVNLGDDNGFFRGSCLMTFKRLDEITSICRWRRLRQGCQMEYFQTKDPILGKFWRVLQWKMSVYLMAIWYISLPIGKVNGHLVHFVVIWNILWSFGTFCDHLEHFVVIWYIFSRFGILYWQPCAPSFLRAFDFCFTSQALFFES
jgi:hypothetical protein